jgi:hypothetical protein
VQNCPVCQRYKKQRKNYGHLPPVQHHPHPWNTVAVDLIGPWTIPQQHNTIPSSPVHLLVLSMIDPDTYWTELAVIPAKTSQIVAQTFDYKWLSRYPRPMECIHDNGSEFIGFEFQELLQSYGIKSIPTTVKNPQANAILERAHQTIANMLRTTNLLSRDLSTPFELSRLMHNVQWALNTTFHTTLKATPSQLVFHRDLILPTKYLANWSYIRQNRQDQANQNNIKENNLRIPHEFHLHDKILIRRDYSIQGKLLRPTEGPYTIIDISQLNINGTVLINRGNSTERINIRRLLPYFEHRN